MYKLRMVEKKTITEDTSRPDKYKIRCYDFLRLTTNAEIMQWINKDVDNPKYIGWGGEEFSREKLGRPYLILNKQKRVEGHEGRHRAVMLLRLEGGAAEMDIDIGINTEEDIELQHGDVISGQHDPKQTVTVGDGTLELTDPSGDNILNISEWGTTWKGKDAYDRFQIFMSRKCDDLGISPKRLVDIANGTYEVKGAYDYYEIGYNYEFTLTDRRGREPTDFINISFRRKF